jgi:MFS family permease
MTSIGLLILVSGFVLMAIASIPEVGRRARGMFPGWFLAGLGALIAALGDTPFYWGLSIWNPVLRNAFGWTAGQMSWAFAMTQVEGGFLGPVEGLLVQKLGPRRAIFIGLTILGIGFVLFSQVQELWQLYTIFFIMAVGSGLAALLPMQTVMNNWFVQYKVRAMSMVLEGIALGGIVVPLLLAWSIGGADPNISERYGWSNTALFIGILIMTLAFPLARLVHTRPEDMGLRPDGDVAAPGAASPVVAGATPLEGQDKGFTVQEAIRTKAFWLISIGHAASSTAIVTILVHLGLMLDDRGLSLHTISIVVAIYTTTAAIFLIIGGYLGDRLPIRLVAFGFCSLMSLSVVALVMAHNTEMIFLVAVLVGAGSGGRTSVMTAMRGIYFGRKAFAPIFGLSRVPASIFLFIAPLFAGLMRDTTGTYDVSFLTIAAVSLFGSFLFLLLGKPPKWSTQAARTKPEF